MMQSRYSQVPSEGFDWDSREIFADFATLDEFLKAFYEHYAGKGAMSIILKEACSVCGAAFIMGLSILIFECVDWSAVTQCTDEDTCRALQDNYIRNPFEHTPTVAGVLTAMYFLFLLCYFGWRTSVAYRTSLKALKIDSFCRQMLKINSTQLMEMDWSAVVERLLASEQLQFYTNSRLTFFDILLRIMRRENYLIAMINRNCLDMFMPWWVAPYTTEELMFTKTMEWSLTFCIFEDLFDNECRLSTVFITQPETLKFRFQVVGLLQLMLLPFTFFFVLVMFFFENAQQFHASGAYLGPRQWTPLAQWEFREFNELPHIFATRLQQSYPPALTYLQGFHSPFSQIIAELVSLITGALLVMLVIISFISEGALLYIHIADRNLLWYLGVLSAVFAASRSVIPDMTKSVESPATLLQRASSFTHHMPPHWQDREHTTAVRDEVSSLLRFKSVILLTELAGVLLTPLVLCFSLPNSAPVVLQFIKNHTRTLNGIGAVCDYSLLELDKYGDEAFGSAPDSQRGQPQEKLHDGKLEKSVLNFRTSYPNQPLHSHTAAYQAPLEAYREGQKQQHHQRLLVSALEASRAVPSFALSRVPIQQQQQQQPMVRRHTTPVVISHPQQQQQLQQQQQQQAAAMNTVNNPMTSAAATTAAATAAAGAVAGAPGVGCEIDDITSGGRPLQREHSDIEMEDGVPVANLRTNNATLDALRDSTCDALQHSHSADSNNNLNTGVESTSSPMIGSGIHTSMFSDPQSQIPQPQSSSQQQDQQQQQTAPQPFPSFWDGSASSEEVVHSPVSPTRHHQDGDSLVTSHDGHHTHVQSRPVIYSPDILHPGTDNMGLGNMGMSLGMGMGMGMGLGMGSSLGIGGGALPDALLSVMREQNIDFRNDFYWLNRFRADHLLRSQQLQQQQQSQMSHMQSQHPWSSTSASQFRSAANYNNNNNSNSIHLQSPMPYHHLQQQYQQQQQQQQHGYTSYVPPTNTNTQQAPLSPAGLQLSSSVGLPLSPPQPTYSYQPPSMQLPNYQHHHQHQQQQYHHAHQGIQLAPWSPPKPIYRKQAGGPPPEHK